MYPIPEHVFNWWQDHQNASGAEIARATGIPPRSARRYRYYMLKDDAYPIKNVPSVKSQHLEEVDRIEGDFDPFEFFEQAPKLIQMAQKRDPIVTHDTFTIDTDRPIGIIFVSCMHLGSRYTTYPEFRRVYEEALETENLYWGSLGDDIEGFLSTFPDVKAIQDQLIDPKNQVACLEALLTPMAETGRLLFGAGSQHGGKWQNRRTGRSDIKDLYVDLHVPYFDGVGYIKFIIGKQTYFIAVAHELPGTSQWNPNQSHAKASKFRFPNAGVVVAGDKHSPAFQWMSAYPDEYEMGNRASPNVLLIQAGTMKTGPDPYTIHSFPKGQLGWPIVVLSPLEHRIEVTMYLDRAKEMLGS